MFCGRSRSGDAAGCVATPERPNTPLLREGPPSTCQFSWYVLSRAVNLSYVADNWDLSIAAWLRPSVLPLLVYVHRSFRASDWCMYTGASAPRAGVCTPGLPASPWCMFNYVSCLVLVYVQPSILPRLLYVHSGVAPHPSARTPENACGPVCVRVCKYE